RPYRAAAFRRAAGGCDAACRGAASALWAYRDDGVERGARDRMAADCAMAARRTWLTKERRRSSNRRRNIYQLFNISVASCRDAARSLFAPAMLVMSPVGFLAIRAQTSDSNVCTGSEA